MEGEEKKREGEKDAHRHAHRNAWLVPNIFYTLRASVKTAQVSLQKQPTQLVCEDSRQSRISLLLCSHHWSQPHLLPHLLPSLSARGLIVDSSPPAPPLTASPCERTPAPCLQCSVQQRRWSPSEPPPLAPQSHSGLVRWSPWQKWHWRGRRGGRKRGSDGPLQHRQNDINDPFRYSGD